MLREFQFENWASVNSVKIIYSAIQFVLYYVAHFFLRHILSSPDLHFWDWGLRLEVKGGFGNRNNNATMQLNYPLLHVLLGEKLWC